jgi:DNA gyrase subunit A
MILLSICLLPQHIIIFLFFTDKGKCYWLKVHEIPEGGRATRGRSILNLIEKEKEEKLQPLLQ